jgi:copper resistance protein B
MTRPLLLAAAASALALALAGPAFAQDNAMNNMPGMSSGGARSAQEKDKKPEPRPQNPDQQGSAASQDRMPRMDHGSHTQPKAGQTEQPKADHSSMDHGSTDQGSMQGMDHSQHGSAAAPSMDMTGTALPAGDAPPPPIPHDHYADRDFPVGEMAGARAAMMKESGGGIFGQAVLNVFEYQFHRGRDGYRWDGEAWYGGDINRLWLKSEGEGEFGRRVDSAEVQALFSHAIDPYFNLQAGVRQDLGRGARRTYATVGFEGLAPGWFEVEGALFLSNKGDLIGRIEGYYDQRITQRLIFQPRAELNLSAQDVPESDIGSGLVNVEVGGRLRYEISRQFAPYVGVSYLLKTGETARHARAAGEDVHATSVVAGIRFWF